MGRTRRIAAATMVVGAISLAMIESPDAALIDRGNGLIYDDVLDVTWVQDVALAQTLGQDSDGRFTWFGAKTWVDQLVYGGYDDWRLPTISPINGVSYAQMFKCDGSADYGYGIAAPGGASAGFTGNELAYMYHVNLGNQSTCTVGPSGNEWAPDVGVQNASFVDPLTGDTVSFLNLEALKRSFWTDHTPDESSLYTFLFKYNGFNDWAYSLCCAERAWAVRDGDVLPVVSPPTTSVPEPGTLPLLWGSLLGFWLLFRRKDALQRVASPA